MTFITMSKPTLSNLVWSRSDIGLHTSPFHDQVFLLGNTIIPMLVIILIDSGDETLVVDLDWHADMTLVVLAGGFDGDLTVGTDEIS